MLFWLIHVQWDIQFKFMSWRRQFTFSCFFFHEYDGVLLFFYVSIKNMSESANSYILVHLVDTNYQVDLRNTFTVKVKLAISMRLGV